MTSISILAHLKDEVLVWLARPVAAYVWPYIWPYDDFFPGLAHLMLSEMFSQGFLTPLEEQDTSFRLEVH